MYFTFAIETYQKVNILSYYATTTFTLILIRTNYNTYPYNKMSVLSYKQVNTVLKQNSRSVNGCRRVTRSFWKSFPLKNIIVLCVSTQKF